MVYLKSNLFLFVSQFNKKSCLFDMTRKKLIPQSRAKIPRSLLRNAGA
jgi:hypothetical protein